MEDLIINFKEEDHAVSITDFAVKYPKRNSKIKPKTQDEIKIAKWLDQMKKKGGWYEISITKERLKLIYDPSPLN